MLYPSTALTIGRLSEAYKRGGDPGEGLLVAAAQIALAPVLVPALLLGVLVAGVYAAVDWCALRIGAATRGAERGTARPRWDRFGPPGHDPGAG